MEGRCVCSFSWSNISLSPLPFFPVLFLLLFPTYRRRVCTFVRLDLPLVRSYWWTSTPHYRLLHSSNTLLHFYYSLILRKRNNPICIFVTIYLSSGRFFAGRKYIFFYFIKRLILALFKQIKKIIRKIYLSLIC